jgi:glycerate-2-kinase
MKMDWLPSIKNKKELLSHGNLEGRKIALDIIEHTLRETIPYTFVKKVISIKGEYLQVDTSEGPVEFYLPAVKNMYVLGGGKGSVTTAKALEEVLGDRIKEGLIVVKDAGKEKLSKIEVMEAAHPLPDERSVRAAKKSIEIAKKCQQDDICFVCITGGTSSLINLPADGISIDESAKMSQMLLNSINNIQEINAVRKHFSEVSGGRLGQYIYPATIVNFKQGTKEEEFKGQPWPDLIFEDPTTFQDAISILKRYQLWEKTPDSVKNHLMKGLSSPDMETPKDVGELKIYNTVIPYRQAACQIAKKRAEELGLNAMILASMLEGESREIGIGLASVAREIRDFHSPIRPPAIIIAGGETSVTVGEEAGEGGRNQEFVLGFAIKVGGDKRLVVAAVDSDGTDGPTNIAGGIADGYTLENAEKKGLDFIENLKKNNSSYVLGELGDAIITGPTGVAVQSIKLVVIL